MTIRMSKSEVEKRLRSCRVRASSRFWILGNKRKHRVPAVLGGLALESDMKEIQKMFGGEKVLVIEVNDS
ncbi:MAG: hypothetical protein D6812_11865 [Deltaproteobacteria bacterium]|nr:MAG: hypothetical protein D6812_11865 [Deltaproteobacteria bacterium]